ncbi:nuclear transport factor 2 family protein [Microbacteriaceae bacterium VKM Ac-2854]|nr:nuclear transport factor 2 family protein [Microbacteriaceae bacterium VKM Ac-2854]
MTTSTTTATSTTTTSTPADAAADRLDIAGVLARHGYALDHRDAALLHSTVTADARLATLLDPLGPQHAPAAIATLLLSRPESASVTTREHVLRNALTTITGDRARVIGELGLVQLELGVDGGAVRRQLDATSVDTLLRTDSGWRLAERRLLLVDVDVAAVTVPIERRALIERGADVLAEPRFLDESTPSSGGGSELLDIEAALALDALSRARAFTAGLGLRHLVSNVKAIVDGDRATAESEFVRTTLLEGGRRRESGVEETRLRRGERGWILESRTESVKSDVSAPATPGARERAAIEAGAAVLRALDEPHPAVLGRVEDARVEIRELLIRYSSAFDQERWELIDDVFTADVDFGGIDAADFVGQAKALYHDRLTGLHSIAEPILRIEGDRAFSYTDFTTIAIHEAADGSADHLDRLRSGGFYLDELRRTEHGWRISKRSVAFSSSVRDTIAGGPELRAAIRRTRERFRAVTTLQD